MKCVAIECEDDATRVLQGNTYCETHYKARVPDSTYAAWPIYAIGLLLWVATWVILFSGVQFGLFSDRILVDSDDRWWFVGPAALGTVVFSASLLLWVSGSSLGDYPTEVARMRAVEMNSSWFLFANGAFLGGGSLFFSTFTETTASSPFLFAFITFVSLSILSVLPVVLLYWIPDPGSPGDSAWLKRFAWLRHFKTVWFYFAGAFFAAAVVALLLSLKTLS